MADSNQESSSKQLLQELDNVMESLKQEWKGEIIVTLDRNGTGVLEDFNICEYIGKYKRDCHDRLYFNITQFPPPPPETRNLPKDDKTWNSLKLYLSMRGHESGSPYHLMEVNGGRLGFEEVEGPTTYGMRWHIIRPSNYYW